MKFKTLALAAVLVVAGHANAAIQSPLEGQGSSLVLAFWNEGAATSSLFDLGLTIDQFSAGTFGSGTYVTWNLKTGSVDSNVALADAVTGNWAAAFSAYGSALTGSVYGVYSADFIGGQADYRAQQTAAVNALDNFTTPNNTQLTGMVSKAGGPFGNANAQLGNHASVDNGGSVAISSDEAYNGGLNGFKANFHGGPLVALHGLDEELYYWQFNGTAGRGTVKTTPTLFDGAFSFDAAAGTLTYSAMPVPEPGTYALMFAGLAAVGAVARRRNSRR